MTQATPPVSPVKSPEEIFADLSKIDTEDDSVESEKQGFPIDLEAQYYDKKLPQAIQEAQLETIKQNNNRSLTLGKRGKDPVDLN